MNTQRLWQEIGARSLKDEWSAWQHTLETWQAGGEVHADVTGGSLSWYRPYDSSDFRDEVTLATQIATDAQAVLDAHGVACVRERMAKEGLTAEQAAANWPAWVVRIGGVAVI